MTELFLVLIALVAVGGLVIAIISTVRKLLRAPQPNPDARKTWATLVTLTMFLAVVLLGLPQFLSLFGGQ